MRRTIWFSLFCLIGLAALVGVRALSPFAGQSAPPKIPDSFDEEDTSRVALKTDNLVDDEDGLRPDKVTVKTLKIFVQPPTPEGTNPAASKKWRPVYARMRGRTHHATHHHRKRIGSRR
jgi:hypothetical protein